MAAVCSWSTCTHLLHRFRAAPSLCACVCTRRLWRNPCGRRTQTTIHSCSTSVGYCTEADGAAESGSVLEEHGTVRQKLRARRAKKGPRALEFVFGGTQTLTLEGARALAAANAARGELVDPSVTAEEASDEPTRSDDLENESRVDLPFSIPKMRVMMSSSRWPRTDQPETIRLVDYLREHHQLTARDQHSYAKSLPSVIGTSVDDIRKRVEEFYSVGFKKSEIDFLLPRFPSLMNFDLQALRNVHDVYRVMQTLRKPEKWLHGLLEHHKFLFLHDSKEVSKQLAVLAKMGLSRRDIAAFLMKEPTFLFHPFTEDCRQRIRSLIAMGFSNRWVIKALYHNLHMHPARLELGPDAAKIVGVVRKILEASPDHLLIMCPQIFQMDVKTLESIIQTLKGKPLYWDTRDLQYLVVRMPSIIPYLAAVKSLSKHLEDLCSAFMSAFKTNRTVLLRSPPVILSEDVEGKVQVFREAGFTDEERVELLSRTPTILLKNTRNDLELRLKLLLSIPNVTPAALIEFDGSLTRKTPLTSHLGVMQARYEYIKKYNEQLLDVSQVKDIFVCSDDQLAELCNQSLQDYYQEMGNYVMSKDGRGHATRSMRPSERTAARLQQKVSAVDATAEVCEKREGSLVGGVYENAPPTGKAHGTAETLDSDKVKQSTIEVSSESKKKLKSRKTASKTAETEDSDKVEQSTTEVSSESKKKRKSRKAASKTAETEDSDKVEQSTTEVSSESKKKRKPKKAASMKKVTSKSRTSGSKSKPADQEPEPPEQEPAPTVLLEGIADEGVGLLDLEDLEELDYLDDSEETEESAEMYY